MSKKKSILILVSAYFILLLSGLLNGCVCHFLDEDEWSDDDKTIVPQRISTLEPTIAALLTPSPTPTSPPTETPSPTPRPTLPGGLPALPGDVVEITYEGEVAYTGDSGDKPPPPPGKFLRTFKTEDITGETYLQYLLEAQQNEWKEIEQGDSLLQAPPPENIEQTYYQKDEQIVSLTYDSEAQILEANVWPTLFTIAPQSDWEKFSQDNIPQPQSGQVAYLSVTTAGDKVVAGRVVIQQISQPQAEAWLQSLQDQGWQYDPSLENRFQSQTARSFGPSYQSPEEVSQEIGQEWRKMLYSPSPMNVVYGDMRAWNALAQFVYDGMNAMLTWLIP
jgi:hypothetical protein